MALEEMKMEMYAILYFVACQVNNPNPTIAAQLQTEFSLDGSSVVHTTVIYESSWCPVRAEL